MDAASGYNGKIKSWWKGRVQTPYLTTIKYFKIHESVSNYCKLSSNKRWNLRNITKRLYCHCWMIETEVTTTHKELHNGNDFNKFRCRKWGNNIIEEASGDKCEHARFYVSVWVSVREKKREVCDHVSGVCKWFALYYSVHKMVQKYNDESGIITSVSRSTVFGVSFCSGALWLD